jgi:hypothetical protein
MDLDSFLVSLYVLVDDWWKLEHASEPPRAGRPALLTDPEVITLAILAQWPRFRSERDFWRFAQAHLCAPTSRSSAPRASSTGGCAPWSPSCATSSVRWPQRSVVLRRSTMSWTPPSSRPHSEGEGFSQGSLLRAGHLREERLQDRVGLRVFKVALSVSPEGVICAFGLAEAASEERPIGDFLIIEDSHDAYLADKGFTGVRWERRWSDLYGALVAATPKDDSKRAWEKTDRRWASGKRQIIEGVIDQLKDIFGLERHRAKTLQGLLARLAAKIAAYTCGQRLNDQLGRPLRHLAELLV